MNDFITQRNWKELQKSFLSAKPFNHIIIDDFFLPEIAEQLALEFPNYDSPDWNAYWNNSIENKKACNHWDKFSTTTYAVFHYLCSNKFINLIIDLTGNTEIEADVGLHGGGQHVHTTSGKLNIHLDYSIHPKLKLQRHYNLIIYLTPDWQPEWGGGLELWSHNHVTETADALIKTVENKFNRAIFFDTTQNSWHGLPNDLKCPSTVMRQSLAVYYITEPESNVSKRWKALFVPREDQKNDLEVLELIKKRSQVDTAESVYKGLK